MNGTAAIGRPNIHSRQSSQSSSRPASAYQSEREYGTSYVQQMRMSKATVWAERGPRDAVSDSRKAKSSSSNKKGRFGMKIFNGSAPVAGQYNKPSKAKLRLYAAPQTHTLVPRLSASEANDNDEFDNFTSSAPPPPAFYTSINGSNNGNTNNGGIVGSGGGGGGTFPSSSTSSSTPAGEKRISNAPSLARSSLLQSMSRNNSIHNGVVGAAAGGGGGGILDISSSVPSSPGPSRPVRMDSVASSAGASSLRDGEDLQQHRRTGSATLFSLPGGGSGGGGSTSGFATSRSGSPTQLQQYTSPHHHHYPNSDSDDEGGGGGGVGGGPGGVDRLGGGRGGAEHHRPKLFVANADVDSDSD